jgi:hypothetical protein
MSYHADGYITVTTNDTVAISIALLSAAPAATLDGVREFGGGDVVTAVIEGLLAATITDDDESGGTRAVTAIFGGKWYEAYEDALQWLAEQGAAVDASFTGEDSCAWGYDAALESGVLTETTVAKTTVNYHAVNDVASGGTSNHQTEQTV